MNFFAIFAAVWAIGNASMMVPNNMGQQKMTGLGMMRGQSEMEYPIAMGMQGINGQEMVKQQRGKRMPKMGQNTQQMPYGMFQQQHQLKMQQLVNNINLIVQQSETMDNLLFQGKEVASQMVDEMVLQAQHEELAQMQECIKQIQQFQGMTTTRSIVQQLAQQQAVQELQKDLMEQQEDIMSGKQTGCCKQMRQTLQVAIEAEMALQLVQNQQSVQNPTETLTTAPTMYNFLHQMQQLLIQNNMEQTKIVIAKHELQVRQIQLQQQYLTKQVEQLQFKQAMMSQQIPQMQQQIPQMQQQIPQMQQQVPQMQQQVPQMQQQVPQIQQQMALSIMQQHQQELMTDLLAQQIIISQLQQVLLVQQTQQQHVTQKYHPVMMMSSRNMPQIISTMNMMPQTMSPMNMPQVTSSLNVPHITNMLRNMPEMMPSMPQTMSSMYKLQMTPSKINNMQHMIPQMMQA